MSKNDKRWIKIEDMRPPRKEWILLWNDSLEYSNCLVGQYIGDGTTENGVDKRPRFRIAYIEAIVFFGYTDWMPLPKRPSNS